MIMDAIHCYLLPDGRDIRSLVPADGYVFVTSYRIIFLGSPWDPEGTCNITGPMCTLSLDGTQNIESSRPLLFNFFSFFFSS